MVSVRFMFRSVAANQLHGPQHFNVLLASVLIVQQLEFTNAGTWALGLALKAV